MFCGEDRIKCKKDCCDWAGYEYELVPIAGSSDGDSDEMTSYDDLVCPRCLTNHEGFEFYRSNHRRLLIGQSAEISFEHPIYIQGLLPGFEFFSDGLYSPKKAA